jgi:hypothetical protein
MFFPNGNDYKTMGDYNHEMISIPLSSDPTQRLPIDPQSLFRIVTHKGYHKWRLQADSQVYVAGYASKYLDSAVAAEFRF